MDSPGATRRCWRVGTRIASTWGGLGSPRGGEPFGPIGRILAIAESVDKLHAICVRCGDAATRNQRLVDGEPVPAEAPTIQVGGAERYEARCRRCHQVPRVGREQTSLLGAIDAEPADARVLTLERLRAQSS